MVVRIANSNAILLPKIELSYEGIMNNNQKWMVKITKNHEKMIIRHQISQNTPKTVLFCCFALMSIG